MESHSINVPIALMLDLRLSPLERNAWMALACQNKQTVTISYEQLSPYIASNPHTKKSSHDTIAKALTLLRLTGWLSLHDRKRDKDGQIERNTYTLHDQALKPHEMMIHDGSYLDLVNQSLNHRSSAIKKVALMLFDELAQSHELDPELPLHVRNFIIYKKLSTDSKSEVSQNRLLRNSKRDKSNFRADSKPPVYHSVQNSKKGVRSSNSIINIILLLLRTYPDIEFPKELAQFSDSKQADIFKQLQKTPKAMIKAVLCEWQERCLSGDIRDSKAYLFGLLKRAQNGSFNAFAKK